MTDDCLPREPVAEAVEALADDPELEGAHLPGSEAEAAYVKGVSDSAAAVRDFSTE